MPKVRSRRYRTSAEAAACPSALSVAEAVKMVKASATAKFDETIDLAIKLNIDSKQADQLVRGSLSLPHGIGKTMRVIAFCEGGEMERAQQNGAVAVGGADLVEKILGGWLEFDVAIAHPAMMRFIGKLGKVLGPKGLMPSPKSGTVTDKVADAVREFAAGKIEFRNDKDGNIHIPVGKRSFKDEKLTANIESAIQHILALRPATVKGDYIEGIFLSSTMGPSVRIAHVGSPAK